MNLKEFYDDREVSEKERVTVPKCIALTVPAKDYDTKPAIAALGLSPFEVNVLWPKGKLSPEEEVLFLRPRLVIQLGKQFSRRFPFIPDGALPDESLKSRALEATADKYVVLHHHDEFSLQDGLGTAVHLGELLTDQRRSFMSVTNHGSIGGWIKQYNVCKSHKLKCIFGCEFYLEHYRGDDPEEKKKHRSAFHLVLLARTKEGFDNIIKIHNDAQLNGFYYSPRVNWDAIRKWGKGIIALTACAGGELPRALMAGDETKAEEAFKVYTESFDKVYVELQIVEMEEQREINRRLIKFAEKVGAETVLSSDSHYLYPEHTETHSLLMYIRQKKTILEARVVDSDVWDFDVGNLFYRNAEQMEEPFRNGFTTKDHTKRAPFLDDVFTEEVFRRSMAKTRQIAMDIEEISLDSKVKLPRLYPDSEKILREKVNAGFKALGLLEKPNVQEYRDRAKHEYEVITRLGFADYFLITEKIVKYAKDTFGEWSVGFGRGSGAGCVISWCLGITDVDPIKYELIFERFLDDSRIDVPDLDLDFDPRCRDQVKDYITTTFGADNTCSIGTYGSYKTRAVILDIARALGLDIHEAMELTKGLELTVGIENEETGEDEDTSIDKVDWDDLIEQFADLKLYFEKHPEVLVHARILRNQVRHMGTHAGGVIISELNLRDRIPVFRDKKDKVVSCWGESGSLSELSSVGLVKFDVLSLCLEENTLVETNKGSVPIRDVEGLAIKYLDGQGKVRLLPPEDYLLLCTGEKDLIEIQLDDGSKILCSGDHKFFRHERQNFRVCEAKNLEVGNFIATTQGSRRIVSIRSAGVGKCCDITVFRRENLFGGEPNFILSNGIVSHNCNLSVVSDCVKLVEQVKGKKLERWEIPIDDKDAIRMGSNRDLVGIFQFENPSVRSVVDAVGMDCLDDVSAITSLIRPGPRNMGMDIEYARRKHGEPYTEVEILRKLLVKTHSTMVYQEDTMKISRELAGFTMAEANRLRRACGKKKADVMAGMRALFMKGAQKKIDEGAITQDEVETVWQKIAAFAKYGFCLSWTTVVRTPRGNKMISELKVGDKVKTPSCLGGRFANVSAVLDQGERELFEVTLESGKRIECTMDHRFLCGDGKKRPLSAILEGGQTIVCEEEQ